MNKIVIALIIGIIFGSLVCAPKTVSAGNTYTNFMERVITLLEKIELNTRK